MNTIIEFSNFKLINLELLKAHLRIENDIENEYLEIVIDMAANIFELQIGKSIAKKKYSYVFTTSSKIIMEKIYLPVQPVIEICFVKQVKSNTSLYFRQGEDNEGIYITLYNFKHPIEIQYYAGMVNSYEQIPKDVQYAVLQIAKNIYDCGDEDITRLGAAQQVLNSYKSVSIS
ncbi:MAG: phage gp6-like head-tail connector protein [Holosporales bacterium]|jgi:uncharacterized phiE125 gp8 family phage protein|nr:phage gp6-like head-tail connector protein [Holosporales bacterium]